VKRGAANWTWTLSMRPAVLGLGAVVLILLLDTAMVVALGARNSWSRREQSRVRVRIDSLDKVGADLRRTWQVMEVLVEATRGRITGGDAGFLAREIDRNARLYDFDPLLIVAVVLTESGADFSAVGRGSNGAVSGALGVMQVQPATARAMAAALGRPVPSRADLMDPAYNLSVGVAYLLQMVHRYGDLRLGIMAYNVGQGGLESGLRGESSLPEAYYRKVLARYRRLRSGFERRFQDGHATAE
jgi:soluble lytic murein transglycosylase-like protein